jgi:hypothetical protein
VLVLGIYPLGILAGIDWDPRIPDKWDKDLQ